jgi:hypothetical protein
MILIGIAALAIPIFCPAQPPVNINDPQLKKSNSKEDLACMLIACSNKR